MSPERRERRRVLGDPATGGSHREEIPARAAVAELHQVQQDTQSLGARAGETLHARVGRCGQVAEIRGEPW